MTEQQAKVMAERLRRVWKPEWDDQLRTNFTYLACIKENENVTLLVSDHLDGLHFSLNYHTMDDDYLGTIKARANGSVEVGETVKCMASEWLPFFRRGCWLSGCPLEASANEKAEWMQGFSREEIESWNLKM